MPERSSLPGTVMMVYQCLSDFNNEVKLCLCCLGLKVAHLVIVLFWEETNKLVDFFGIRGRETSQHSANFALHFRICLKFLAVSACMVRKRCSACIDSGSPGVFLFQRKCANALEETLYKVWYTYWFMISQYT